MTKLTYDLIVEWLSQSLRSKSLWLASVFLSIPICVLGQMYFVQKAYLEPTFANMKNPQFVRSAVLYQDGKYQALEHYLAREISENWPAKVSYERTKWVSASVNGNDVLSEVSFMSGGYDMLGVKPQIGKLDTLEFPIEGSQVFAAISHKFWKEQFNFSPRIIGKTIIISNNLVTISAVMPESFRSFQKNRVVDLIIPFEHISTLNIGAEKEILPDTHSYVIAETNVLNDIENTLEAHLIDQVLLFDDAKVILNGAFGVDNQEYLIVIKRIYLLFIIFVSLLIFCSIAFVAFFVGLLTQKQNEYTVRLFCGASNKQIFWQEIVDLFLVTVFIVFCCVFAFPIVSELVKIFLPQVEASYFAFPWYRFITFLTFNFISLIVILGIVSIFQRKLFATYVGRGQTLSFGQKVQSYFLCSLLVCVSSIALLITSTTLKYQQELNAKPLGFDVKLTHIINFDFPKAPTKNFSASRLPELLLQNLTAYSEIQDAAITNVPPFLNKTSYSRFYTPSLEPIGSGEHGNVLFDYISPNYFDAIGIKLLQGNNLISENYWQVIVNKTLWDKYFNGYSIADAKLITNDDDGSKFSLDIVGVVDDTLLQGRDMASQPMVYRSIVTITGYESLIIKSTASVMQIENVLNRSLSEVDVDFGNFKVESLEELARKENTPRQALFAVSLVGSVIMFLSTLVYTTSSVNQLVKKGGRETALRRCVGASLVSLTVREFRLFLQILIPMIFVTFYFLSNYEASHLNHINLGMKFDTNLFFVPVFLMTTFVLFVFIFLFSRNSNSSWNNLT